MQTHTAPIPRPDTHQAKAAPDEKVIVRHAGEGQLLKAFGDEVTILFAAEQTQGKFTLFIDQTPPGGGPPPHFHLNEDELFHVLEGSASFYADGKWTDVKAGSTVYAPRGSIHTFRNVGTTPLRQLIRTSPSGFETFFARCAEVFSQPGGPDMERILQIGAQHGIHFVQPQPDARGTSSAPAL